MIISGDMNFPNIPWDSLQSVGVLVNEEAFVDTLNDHYLSQVNRLGTRGRNILHSVILTNTVYQIE